MNNEYKKHQTAKKINKTLNSNKPLSNDISGQYSYNFNKKELLPLNINSCFTYKKVHSIRIGDFNNNLFINHTDYSVKQTNYSIKDECIWFDYNSNSYYFSIEKGKNIVQIEMVKE